MGFVGCICEGFDGFAQTAVRWDNRSTINQLPTESFILKSPNWVWASQQTTARQIEPKRPTKVVTNYRTTMELGRYLILVDLYHSNQEFACKNLCSSYTMAFNNTL
eukprot:2318082-Amphidinium_carterae.1